MPACGNRSQNKHIIITLFLDLPDETIKLYLSHNNITRYLGKPQNEKKVLFLVARPLRPSPQLPLERSGHIFFRKFSFRALKKVLFS